MKVALIAALPREVRSLVKGWEQRVPSPNVHVWVKGNAVVACAGMGAARVALAVDAAMAAMPVTCLISVGLAGGCDPLLRAGDIVRAGVVIDERSGERFIDPAGSQILVSTDRIVSVSHKAALLDSYSAVAVDMEAAAVARIARERGVEFRAIKAISDDAAFEMAWLSRFAAEDGQFRERAFALHAALRPRMWGRVIALGRGSSRALAALTRELRVTLDCYEKKS